MAEKPKIKASTTDSTPDMNQLVFNYAYASLKSESLTSVPYAEKFATLLKDPRSKPYLENLNLDENTMFTDLQAANRTLSTVSSRAERSSLSDFSDSIFKAVENGNASSLDETIYPDRVKTSIAVTTAPEVLTSPSVDDNTNTLNGREISSELQLDFLTVFDNVRLNAQRTYLETDAYDPEVVAYHRRLLEEFTGHPDYKILMAPIAERLNRPDLLTNPPLPAPTESFMAEIETPYALEDAQGNAGEIYSALASDDVDLLFSLGYEPVSRTLAADQVESYIVAIIHGSDAKISEEIDVATSVLEAHSNTLDIAGQYASIQDMSFDETAAYLDHAKLLQAQAQAELANIDALVIPSSMQVPAIEILAAMNDATAESTLSDTPPVIIDVAAELDAINAANEPVAVDVAAAIDHFNAIAATRGLEPIDLEQDSSPNLNTSTPDVVLAEVKNISIDSISDASILLDGEASNDIAYLKDLVEEAKAAGVDLNLITSIETQIESKDFVTTQAATQGVQSYADALKAALENDGVLSKGEYNGALTNLFSAISSGMVVDRKGMADDIAAAPGMEIQAQESLRRIFDMKAEGLVAANLASRPVPKSEVVPSLGLTG